jgi:hypothetical protein
MDESAGYSPTQKNSELHVFWKDMWSKATSSLKSVPYFRDLDLKFDKSTLCLQIFQWQGQEGTHTLPAGWPESAGSGLFAAFLCKFCEGIHIQ